MPRVNALVSQSSTGVGTLQSHVQTSFVKSVALIVLGAESQIRWGIGKLRYDRCSPR
jgi:hypothetical protein